MACLRTGEVEDLLEDPKARFAALIVDVGEDDMIQCSDYADAFGDRLEERGIPRDRFHFQKVALEVPERKDLFGTLRRMREFLKLEFPRYYWNPNYEPWLPSNIQLPETGDHLPAGGCQGDLRQGLLRRRPGAGQGALGTSPRMSKRRRFPRWCWFAAAWQGARGAAWWSIWPAISRA